MLRVRILLASLVLLATLVLPNVAQAQFRNNGIYLPQAGYLTLETINGRDTFGSSDLCFVEATQKSGYYM